LRCSSGVGASRVPADLCQTRQGRKQGPCLIFIDEIDAVDGQRGAGIGGGNDERNQTLNQLLTEWIGFEGIPESFIIAGPPTAPMCSIRRWCCAPAVSTAGVRLGRSRHQGSRLVDPEVHPATRKLAEGVWLEAIARGPPRQVFTELISPKPAQ